MGYIYKITNINTNKCYIGETVQKDPERRWKKHISSANTTKDCPVLAAAIRKYGVDQFKFEILIICFDEDTYKYEKEYIKKFNSQVPNGYNILDGGQYGGSRLGINLSKETKDKLSKSLKEFHLKNPNHYELFKDKHIAGMKTSINWIKALEENRVGTHSNNSKPKTQEIRNKISKSVKLYFENNGSSINKENHSKIMTQVNGRKVSQHSKDGNLIATFDSIKIASTLTSTKRSSIQAAAAGRIKMAGGYIWKYIETELKDF